MGRQSWEGKAKVLGCSFRNLTKSLTVGTRSVKGKWANQQQLAKIY